jgi:hypothetical protein
LDDLTAIVAREAIDDVVVALADQIALRGNQKIINLLEEQASPFVSLSDFFPRHLARCQPSEFEGEPLLFFHSAPCFSWRTEVKRLIDLIASIAF